MAKAKRIKENHLSKVVDDFDQPVFIDPASIEVTALTNKPKITITKGKLLKGDKIEVDYTKKDSSDSKPAKCSEEHSDPPTKGFRDAFGSLAVHAALIGEFIPLTSISDINEPDPEVIKDFNVSGFTVVGEDDDEGVILTAQKTLKTGKIVGFNTPTIRFNDASDNAYPHLDELATCVTECKTQLRKYLNGEHAEDPQLKMELN